MQIVIEIPREMYEQFKIIQMFPTDKIIANGTPLPEHHGDLIDRNELHYYCEYDNGLGCDKICRCDGCVHNVIKEITVNATSIIIPATKEGDGE